MAEASVLTSNPVTAESPQTTISTQSQAPAVVTTPSDWRSSLPEDLKADPSLEGIQDIATLAKNYVYTKKHVGSDKVVVPGKHATPEDWKNYFKAAGQPDSIDKYEVKLSEADKAVDENLFKAFKELAFNENILPHQAEKLVSWFNQSQKQAVEAQASQMKQAQLDGINGLRKEWGNAFQSKLSKAQIALKEFADPQIVSYLEETGLGNDARLIKLLSNIGESFSEDKVRAHIDSSMAVMSPDKAKADLNTILSNYDHPYHQAQHPNHAAAVKEMEDLFRNAYPSS